jgi:hypothetical protein
MPIEAGDLNPQSLLTIQSSKFQTFSDVRVASRREEKCLARVPHVVAIRGISTQGNTARLRKIVGWVELPNRANQMLGFVPQPNLHGLRFLGKTYAVLQPRAISFSSSPPQNEF